MVTTKAPCTIPRFPEIAPAAYDLAATTMPELKRIVAIARPKIHALVAESARSLPLPKRMIVMSLWWPILKFLLAPIAQLIIEYFLHRRGAVATEECSPCVRGALQGDGLDGWNEP